MEDAAKQKEITQYINDQTGSADNLSEQELDRVMDAVVEIHLPMVRDIAEIVYQRCSEKIRFEDLYNAGMFAMVNAMEQFDWRGRQDFLEFCRARIFEAAEDSLRLAAWLEKNSNPNQ